MKLFTQFNILSGLACGSSIKDPRAYNCDITELQLPSQAEEWDCNGETGSLVPAGSRCTLKCDDGFVPTAYSRRIEQVCKSNGWRKPDQVDVQCKMDVNEVGEKVDETIESLVNNNLWKSCTIQGETRDWESFNDNGRNTGTIHATVDMSSFGLTEIKRINTWLSCSTRCWTSTGAQNVYLRPNKPDQFEIFISQHNDMISITTGLADQWDYVLHYEVEGSC